MGTGNQGSNAPAVRYRVTVQDEDGKVRFQDLVDQFLSPQLILAQPQLARVAAATFTTSYAPFMIISGMPKIFQVFNSMGSGSDIGIAINGVEKWRLEGESFQIDNLRQNFLTFGAGSVLSVKYYTQPTTGSLRVVIA